MRHPARRLWARYGFAWQNDRQPTGQTSMADPRLDLTRLLADWRAGDRTALDRLLPSVERELHRIARHRLGRERKDHPMHASSLVQEALVRLLPEAGTDWTNRAHFFAVATRVMRHVLVDHARQRQSLKRGGGTVHVSLDVQDVLSPEQVEEVVAIDLALVRLAEFDERKSKVFELRFFGGLDIDETAEALGIGARTVVRDWNLARAWLRRELSGESSGHGPVVAD